MNRRILTTIFSAASACLCSVTLCAATPSSSKVSDLGKIPPASIRYDNVHYRNPWLRSGNVAGMRSDSLSISEALLGGQYSAGENRLLSRAPRQWEVGASASTIMHLKRFSMAGSFSFLQTTMYDACGGMFLSQGRYPVEIYEYTPGTKSRQQYSFNGGFSVDLNNQWRIGAVVDFKSTNYSKRKDLRYTDYALDLSLRPGLQWHSDKWSVGVSALLQRNTETITAEQIGVAQTTYLAFLDKGMFFGVEQSWDGGGVHLSEPGISGFPVRSVGWGASAQLSWSDALYFDLSFIHGDGSIGEKDAIWMIFPSDEFASTLQWKLHSDSGTEHILCLDASLTKDRLDENVIEKVTQSGVTTRKIYSSNVVSSRSNLCITPCWTAVRPSVYELKVEASYTRGDALSSCQYPYLNGQILQSVSFAAEARYTTGARLTPILGVWAETGFLDEDSRIAGDIVSKTSPVRQQTYYDNWKWFATTPGIGVRAGLRYTFANALYLELSGNAVFRGGKNRHEAGLSFGYTF